MKKFLVKLCIFLFSIIIIDICFGFIIGYINDNVNCDDAGRDNYICNKLEADILVFGSSRAQHHYNTVMISDSLGVPSFNCGEAGYGIFLSYGRFKMILDRYTPKVIIYDITPAFDYLDYNDNPKHLYRLKNFYNRNGVDSIFWDIDPKEKYKMISSMYKYNSSYLRSVFSFFVNMPNKIELNGYEPMTGSIDKMKINKGYIDYDSKAGYKYDLLKIKYLRKFIDLAKTKKIKILLVSSPVWYGQDSKVLEPIKEICNIDNVKLVDYSNDNKYVHRDQYFKDGKHLNAKGADVFTKDIIKEIKLLLNGESS